jgi:thymidine phosphorylase
MEVAPDREFVTAPDSGVLVQVLAGGIGRASHELGAGRSKVGDPVDHAVGVRLLAARGDRVERGQPLVELHHRGGHGLTAARALCREAIHVAEGGQALPAGERILGEVR